jgi:hypothetical protein
MVSMHGRVKNPERWSETYGRYWRGHRPHVYAQNRRYRERHRDEIRARNKAACERDPEVTRQRTAAEYQRNRDRYRAYVAWRYYQQSGAPGGADRRRTTIQL